MESFKELFIWVCIAASLPNSLAKDEAFLYNSTNSVAVSRAFLFGPGVLDLRISFSAFSKDLESLAISSSLYRNPHSRLPLSIYLDIS